MRGGLILTEGLGRGDTWRKVRYTSTGSLHIILLPSSVVGFKGRGKLGVKCHLGVLAACVVCCVADAALTLVSCLLTTRRRCGNVDDLPLVIGVVRIPIGTLILRARRWLVR